VSPPVPEPFWPDIALSDFTPPVCEGGQYRMTVGLNPAYMPGNLDYIGFRVAYVDPYYGNQVSKMIDETALDGGSACDWGPLDSTLTLTQTCDAPPGPCLHYLELGYHVPQGSGCAAAMSPADMATLLGPIDTLQEAMLMAHQGTSSGFWISCNGDTGARVVADGYEVLVVQKMQDCPVVYDRVLLHVATDGTISELRRSVASVYPTCI
jgi:hypothetical protein